MLPPFFFRTLQDIEDYCEDEVHAEENSVDERLEMVRRGRAEVQPDDPAVQAVLATRSLSVVLVRRAAKLLKKAIKTWKSMPWYRDIHAEVGFCGLCFPFTLQQKKLLSLYCVQGGVHTDDYI